MAAIRADTVRVHVVVGIGPGAFLHRLLGAPTVLAVLSSLHHVLERDSLLLVPQSNASVV